MSTLATGFAVIPDSIVTSILWFQNQYPLIGLLMVLMFVDVATGLIAARIEGTLSSSTSWVGMGKKVIMLLAVGTGNMIEPLCGLPLGRMFSMFYIVTELISVTENMARAGVPVPKSMKDSLAKLKAREEESDGK